jgi:hypothetical protein
MPPQPALSRSSSSVLHLPTIYASLRSRASRCSRLPASTAAPIPNRISMAPNFLTNAGLHRCLLQSLPPQPPPWVTSTRLASWLPWMSSSHMPPFLTLATLHVARMEPWYCTTYGHVAEAEACGQIKVAGAETPQRQLGTSPSPRFGGMRVTRIFRDIPVRDGSILI